MGLGESIVDFGLEFQVPPRPVVACLVCKQEAPEGAMVCPADGAPLLEACVEVPLYRRAFLDRGREVSRGHRVAGYESESRALLNLCWNTGTPRLTADAASTC